MNKRRLLKLADLLEADAKNKKGVKFDLAAVIMGPNCRGETPKLDCGTAACAIGLWALSGKFRDVNVVHIGGFDFWPVYKGRSGRNAAELYFEITDPESAWLFLPNFYAGKTTGAVSERAVAKRIRDFVAGKAAP